MFYYQFTLSNLMLHLLSVYVILFSFFTWENPTETVLSWKAAPVPNCCSPVNYNELLVSENAWPLDPNINDDVTSERQTVTPHPSRFPLVLCFWRFVVCSSLRQHQRTENIQYGHGLCPGRSFPQHKQKHTHRPSRLTLSCCKRQIHITPHPLACTSWYKSKCPPLF